MHKAPVHLSRLSGRKRVLYYGSIAIAVALVVLGWLFSTRQALSDYFASAKNSVADSAHTVSTEFGKAQALRAQAQEGASKAKSTGGSLIQLFEKKQAVSQTVIESLKATLETDASYGTKETH